MKEDYAKVKLIVIIKKQLMIEKGKLDKYNKFIEDTDIFIDNIMIDIKHQFIFFVQNNSVLINLGGDGVPILI